MKFKQAFDIALDLVEKMGPYCERVEIAGSLRRGVSEVKDIEVVAIPSWEERTQTAGLFGEQHIEHVNLLHEWACIAELDQLVTWIKPGTHEIIPWSVKKDGKAWRGLLPEGIKLDLFLCGPRNWGAIFLIRTGGQEFSRAIAALAKEVGRPLDKGFFHRGDIEIETPEEEDVFQLLGLPFVEPHLRIDENAAVPRSTHRCAAPGCSKNVPVHQLMCGVHWFQVPKGLRDDVWRLYRNAQSGNASAIGAHRRACAEAVRALKQPGESPC